MGCGMSIAEDETLADCSYFLAVNNMAIGSHSTILFSINTLFYSIFIFIHTEKPIKKHQIIPNRSKKNQTDLVV